MPSGFQPTLSYIGDQSSEDVVEDDQVILLKARLGNDPYNYELHLALVNYLQDRNCLIQLRKARSTMQDLFPLSSSLWLRWLEDECGVYSNCHPLSTVSMNELFEKALLDQPFSTDIWLKYLEYSSSYKEASDMRDLFERALNTAGYNLINGFKIFQFLEEYLLTHGAPEEQAEQACESENVTFSDLYAVRLKIPHLDATLNAFHEYEAFNAKHNLQLNLQLTQEHTIILDIYTKVEPTLRVLSDNPVETNFKKAINFFTTDDDALCCADNYQLVEAIYEMALSFDEVNVRLWKEYIGFVSKTESDRVSDVYRRAVRFVPWDVVIWCNYLHFCSCNLSDGVPRVEKVFNDAISVGFNFPEQNLLLHQTYISHFFHHGTADRVMEAFESAFQFFVKYYGEESPSLMVLYELKGDYLLLKEQDDVKYIEFWDALLEIDEKEESVSENRKIFPSYIWVAYIKQLLNFELYDKAMEVVNFSVDKVPGSDLPALVANVTNLMLLFGVQEQGAVVDFLSNIDSAVSSIVQYNLVSSYKQQTRQKPKKYKETAKNERNKKPLKRTKQAMPSKFDSDGFKVPVKSPKLTPTPPAPPSKTSQSTKLAKEGKTEEVSDLSSVEKIPKERKERTVFLSNISFDVDEETLKLLFQDCGDVVEVRLAKSRTNRSKGYGYLEFADVESAKKALLLDRTHVNSRPLYVSPCIDKTKESLPFKYNTNFSENVLFVNKLSRETTLDKLQQVFSELADGIKEIRLVTNRSGKSKGYAYVELIDSATASKALMMYDGVVIDGSTVCIAKSHPPKRKEFASKQPSSSTNVNTFVSNRPSAKNDNSLSTMKPRLIALKSNPQKAEQPEPSTSAAAATAAATETPNSNLTNSYFKNLFK